MAEQSIAQIHELMQGIFQQQTQLILTGSFRAWNITHLARGKTSGQA